MRRAALLVLLLAARAHADPPRTWIGNDEAVGETIANGRWSFWGAGLGVTRTLFCHVELGLEGQVLRLDSLDSDDPRHGFALRAGATLAYRIPVSHFMGIDWGIAPELGAATSTLFGIGPRAQHEFFGDVRGSFRYARDDRDGIGVHLTLRVARAEGELAASFMLGYDWGLGSHREPKRTSEPLEIGGGLGGVRVAGGGAAAELGQPLE